MNKPLWRQGTKVPINIYEGERPVCQCQTAADAKRIVQAVNFATQVQALDKPTPKRGRPHAVKTAVDAAVHEALEFHNI